MNQGKLTIDMMIDRYNCRQKSILVGDKLDMINIDIQPIPSFWSHKIA